MRSRRGLVRLAWLLAAGELPALVLAGSLAVTLRPDRAPHPERFTARIAACDLGGPGGATISYTLRNGDRARHGYRVELTVVTATRVLGSGASLMPHVDPGATVTGQALIPVQGDRSGATCKARAVVFDGSTGHH
jgi:hypothetical protein